MGQAFRLQIWRSLSDPDSEKIIKIFHETTDYEMECQKICGKRFNTIDEHTEFIKNGAEVIHFATGLVVGYPPCPYVEQFHDFIKTKYNMEVVIGTHPIPQKYYDTHLKLETWNNESWQQLIQPTVANETIRKSYD